MDNPKDRVEMLDMLGLRNKCCVEIGVLKGDYSNEILKQKPSDLYLIDPWTAQDKDKYVDIQNVPQPAFDDAYHHTRDRFKDAIQVQILRMFSHEAAREVTRNNIDFVYIDANHSFSHCLSDMMLWLPKIKNGGWLCGHDYDGFPGVSQAVSAFCRITGYKLAFVTQEAVWRSFGIRIENKA